MLEGIRRSLDRTLYTLVERAKLPEILRSVPAYWKNRCDLSSEVQAIGGDDVARTIMLLTSISDKPA